MEHKKILKLKKGKQSELLLKAINKSSSQRALSEILKIPRRTLRNYLCERNLIPLSLLQKLLQYLSMDLDAINANIEIEVEKNWGSKKGGLKSVAKLNNKSISNRMKHARSFRKNIIKKRIFEMNSSFYELYGILMGDGCISRYKDSEKMRRCDVFISGDKRYEKPYYLHIKKLLKNNFDINCYLYEYEKNNTIRITIRCKAFSDFLLDLGFPVGYKYNNLFIPKKMLNVEWEKLKYLIRGLFDTDGTIFAKKNEEYKYPYIGISSKSPRLLLCIQSTLRRQGYPFYINNKNLFMKGIKNVNRWMADVGSSNQKHIIKYQYWLKNGKLPANLKGQ